MGQKRCIELTETEQLTLREGIRNHPKHEFRRCCRALLWSHKGWAAKAVASELKVCPQTVGQWLTNWQKTGLVGLMRQAGQGRKPILSVTNTTHQQALDQAVEAHYQDSERIKVDLQASLGLSMSRDTVKRFLKKTIIRGIASGGRPSPGKTPQLTLTGYSACKSC